MAIIRANTDVKVDGEICYVSCQNVKLTGTDSVSIRDGYYLETGGVTADCGCDRAGEHRHRAASGNRTGGNDRETVHTDDTEQTESTSGDGSFETDVYTFIVYK